MIPFNEHKFCTHCGRMLQLKGEHTYNSRTGEATLVRRIKICPQYNDFDDGQKHGRIQQEVFRGDEQA